MLSTTASYSNCRATVIEIRHAIFGFMGDQTFGVSPNSRFKTGFINPAAVILHVNSNGVTHKRSLHVQSII